MPETKDAKGIGPTLKERVDAYERGLIEAALRATSGNQRQAALRLGVLPTTLHEKMKRLGMISRAGRPSPVAAEAASGLPAPAF
jgi:two-component system response regulator HydG